MWGLLTTAPEASERLPGGYGAALLQGLLALVAVSILAWVVLRWAAKVGFGRVPPGRSMALLDHMPLDARRALYLVRVGPRFLLLGVGEGDAPRLLAELAADEVPTELRGNPRARGGGAFARVLARARGGQAAAADDQHEGETES